jgi:hypothetical protein
VRGFSQTHDDYGATFAPVVQYKSVRVCLAVAAQLDYESKLLDVETAYLHAPVEEDLYILAPKGFVGPEAGQVLKLNKSLYGLKQAGRNWNKDLVGTLISIGYTPCVNSDSCLFTKVSRSHRCILIAIFVDDIPHFFHRDDTAEMNEDKAKLMARYKIKDLGECVHLLGMRITRNRKDGTLRLDQQTYIESMLETFGFSECKTEHTPESTGKLSTRDASAPASAERSQVTAARARTTAVP